MIRPLLAALLLASPAAADPFDNGAATFRRGNDGWAPAWFLCDGTDRRVAYAIDRPDRAGRVQVWSYTKPQLMASAGRFRIGAADPGMSQVHYPLADPRGREVGFLHAVQPTVYGAPVGLPSFTSVRFNPAATACRFAPTMRLLAITTGRVVRIDVDPRGRPVYAAYGHRAKPGAAPDIRLAGGTARRIGARELWEFRNRGTTYRINASRDPAAPGLTLSVLSNGRVQQVENGVAYSIAAPRR